MLNMKPTLLCVPKLSWQNTKRVQYFLMPCKGHDNGGGKAWKVLFHPEKYHQFCPLEFTSELKFPLGRIQKEKSRQLTSSGA